MRIISAVVLGSLALGLSGDATRADFILNCRLMDPTHPKYDRYCKGQISGFLSRLVEECPAEGACTIRLQNFKGAYSAHGGTLAETASTVTDTPPSETPQTGLAAIDSGAEQTAQSVE
jgi:hypothetical protein